MRARPPARAPAFNATTKPALTRLFVYSAKLCRQTDHCVIRNRLHYSRVSLYFIRVLLVCRVCVCVYHSSFVWLEYRRHARCTMPRLCHSILTAVLPVIFCCYLSTCAHDDRNIITTGNFLSFLLHIFEYKYFIFACSLCSLTRGERGREEGPTGTRPSLVSQFAN